MIFALGFALERVAAMQEHGIKGTSLSQYLRDNMMLTSITKYISRGLGYAPCLSRKFNPA